MCGWRNGHPSRFVGYFKVHSTCRDFLDTNTFKIHDGLSLAQISYVTAGIWPAILSSTLWTLQCFSKDKIRIWQRENDPKCSYSSYFIVTKNTDFFSKGLSREFSIKIQYNHSIEVLIQVGYSYLVPTHPTLWERLKYSEKWDTIQAWQDEENSLLFSLSRKRNFFFSGRPLTFSMRFSWKSYTHRSHGVRLP